MTGSRWKNSIEPIPLGTVLQRAVYGLPNLSQRWLNESEKKAIHGWNGRSSPRTGSVVYSVTVACRKSCLIPRSAGGRPPRFVRDKRKNLPQQLQHLRDTLVKRLSNSCARSFASYRNVVQAKTRPADFLVRVWQKPKYLGRFLPMFSVVRVPFA